MIPGIVASGASMIGGGETVFAAWDPSATHAELTLSGGDLVVTKNAGSGFRSTRSTIGVSSGKHYWEYKITTDGGQPDFVVGVGTTSATLAGFVGTDNEGRGYYQRDGSKYKNGVGAAFGGAYSNGSVINVALDMDAGKVYFGINGSWIGGHPADGTGAAFSDLSGLTIHAMVSPIRSASPAHVLTANFGETAFAHTVPSGFRAGLYS